MEANEARIIPEDLRECTRMQRSVKRSFRNDVERGSNRRANYALIERIADQAKQISDLQAENARLKQPGR